MRALRYFAASRQMRLEGGFQGRTNKLVDGCYSFWMGAIFPLIHDGPSEAYLFCQESLQTYILACCQDYDTGGLLDKPEKPPDFYHTCYCLSGLSVAQHTIRLGPGHQVISSKPTAVVGRPSNLLVSDLHFTT